MASANVGPPTTACHFSTGSWLVTMVERTPCRSSMITMGRCGRTAPIFSREHERMLAKGGWRSRVHRKVLRNRPLMARSREANRKRSKVRAALEHVFAQHEAMGGKRVRTIGLSRIRVKIGMDESGVQPALARVAQSEPPSRYAVPGKLKGDYVGESHTPFDSQSVGGNIYDLGHLALKRGDVGEM